MSKPVKKIPKLDPWPHKKESSFYPIHDEGGCAGSLMLTHDARAICCSCKAVYLPSVEKMAQIERANAAAGITEPIRVGRPSGPRAMPEHLTPDEKKALASCGAGRGARLLPVKVAGLVAIGLVKEWTENDGPGGKPKIHRIDTHDGARVLKMIEAIDAAAKVEHVDMFAPQGGFPVVAPVDDAAVARAGRRRVAAAQKRAGKAA